MVNTIHIDCGRQRLVQVCCVAPKGDQTAMHAAPAEYQHGTRWDRRLQPFFFKLLCKAHVQAFCNLTHSNARSSAGRKAAHWVRSRETDEALYGGDWQQAL